MLRSLLLAAAVVAAPAVHANEVNPIFVGAALGQANWKPACDAVFCDRAKGTAGKVWLGYQFDAPRDSTVLSSLEAIFMRSGTVRETAAALPQARTKFDAFGLSYKLAYRAGVWSTHARAGAAYVSTRQSFGDEAHENNRFGLTYGVGAGYQVNSNWRVVVDADHVAAPHVGYPGRSNVPVYSIGANYQFD
jgi:hypothetical protein